MSSVDYRVEFGATARRTLNRMPEKTATAAVEFCFGPLAANPHRLGKPLQRELFGYHTARRGDYRVIYRIDEAARLLFVLRIEHRGDVYRPR